MDIQLKLQELFVKWKEGIPSFCKDGIMLQPDLKDPELISRKWKNLNKRVAFLLKDYNEPDETNVTEWFIEVYNDKGVNTNGNATANCNLEPIKINGRFKRNIFLDLALFLYNIQNIGTDYKEIRECYAHTDPEIRRILSEAITTIPFVYMECKKSGGDKFCSDPVLLSHLNTYREYIIEELNILQPNIIICFSPFIFNLVDKEFSKGEPEKKEYSNGDHNHKMYYYPQKKVAVINSFHPSCRKKRTILYDNVISPFKSFIEDGNELSDYVE